MTNPLLIEGGRRRSPALKRLFSASVGLAVSAMLFLPAQALAASKWVSGFYVGWMANSYPPSAIDFSALSHVMMFSVLPQNNGTLDTSFFGAGSGVAVEVAQRAHGAAPTAGEPPMVWSSRRSRRA